MLDKSWEVNCWLKILCLIGVGKLRELEKLTAQVLIYTCAT